jgi:ABC-2 type transport system ATP-binding protein
MQYGTDTPGSGRKKEHRLSKTIARNRLRQRRMREALPETVNHENQRFSGKDSCMTTQEQILLDAASQGTSFSSASAQLEEAAAAAAPSLTGVPVIHVERLTRRFGELEAVKGISFDVYPGEIFGFPGPNGAGKSTTINMLCTLLKPTSGKATLAGYDISRQAAQVREAIGLVFQDPSLDDRLTADENLRVVAQIRRIW